MRTYLLLTLSLSVLACIQASDSFGFTLERMGSLCIGEQVTPGLRLQGNISVSSAKNMTRKTKFRLLNEQGGEILMMRDKMDYFFDVSVSYIGTVQLCFYNEDPGRTIFYVDLKTGAQIVDKDHEILTKDGKAAIEHQVKRWGRILKSIQTKMNLIVKNEQEKLTEADNVSYWVKVLSFFSSLVCVGLAVVQTKLMRAFFLRKKII